MINISIKQFDGLLAGLEDCNLEFKTASNQFDSKRDLPDYCAALANEKGGKLILGVNKQGEITGTRAFFGTHNTLSNTLFDKIGIRVDVQELMHPNGRVLIFHVPSRPIGKIIHSTGHYRNPMRAGESLREMDDQTMKSILNENATDFSMGIVPGLTIADLDVKSMKIFKEKWAKKSNRDEYRSFSAEKMLRSVDLLTDKGLNYASLILFGKKETIDELLPDSEIIFEWRQNAASITHDFRAVWREPFFSVYDVIWETINARNIRMPFQQGFIQREIFAFDEKSIREAVLNAVAHRDYSIRGQSIFIKASPEAFVISSPGGLPPGVTIENILYKSAWRNRRIAEVFEKAGLVERSGQGMDDIFHASIRDGKGQPDLSRSDEYSVVLDIPARLKDKEFILFLEKITNEKQIVFSFEDMLDLETIRQNRKPGKKDSLEKFIKLGLVEKTGKGRGTRYILSHRYYSYSGKTGIHTRLSGISREKQKELIIKDITKNKKGFPRDFQDIFPELKPMDISNLLRELQEAGKVRHCGSKRHGHWELA